MSESEEQVQREQARIDDVLSRGTTRDREQLDETHRALKGLREAGVEVRSYGVISPYERKRLRIARESSAKPNRPSTVPHID